MARRCKRLETLILENCNLVGDPSVLEIAKLPNLTSINLYYASKVTSSSIGQCRLFLSVIQLRVQTRWFGAVGS